MPIDYTKYPPNWKTEIRPNILARANHKCEFCGIPNYKVVLRGSWKGIEVYQDGDGNIFNADNSELIGADYVGEVHPTNTLIKVVLTIAHLDHNIHNNTFKNLRALCQRCHNRHDARYRLKKRKKKQLNLFAK